MGVIGGEGFCQKCYPTDDRSLSVKVNGLEVGRIETFEISTGKKLDNVFDLGALGTLRVDDFPRYGANIKVMPAGSQVNGEPADIICLDEFVGDQHDLDHSHLHVGRDPFRGSDQLSLIKQLQSERDSFQAAYENLSDVLERKEEALEQARADRRKYKKDYILSMICMIVCAIAAMIIGANK